MQFVRGVYAFSTGEAGEISITPGDIIQVLDIVDENWLCGHLHGQVGNFPKNFVQPIHVPYEAGCGQKVFKATKQFSTGVEGDLVFSKGDVIVGINQVDDNWWYGEHNASQGIFPLTHADEIPIISPPTQNNTSQNPQPSTKQTQPANAVARNGELALVRATMDLTAQLDDELEFSVGDFIHVIEVLDHDFAIGKSGNKTGMFPLSFVEVVEGTLEIKSEQKNDSASHAGKFDWFKTNNNDIKIPDISNQVRASSPQVTPHDTHVPAKSESASVRDGGDGGMSVTADSDMHVDQSVSGVPGDRASGSYTAENTMSYDMSIMPYGKTLYPFIAEKENELTFMDNEIVTLICHVDDQWIEGEIDGIVGIFPASYVEIIVDCPYASPTPVTPAAAATAAAAAAAADDEEEEPAMVNDIEPAHEDFSKAVYGRVLFDFQASAQYDIDLKEGDTVTILRKADDYWFEAHHDDGRTGMVPISYVEVIEEPLPSSTPGTPIPPSLDSQSPMLHSQMSEESPTSKIDVTSNGISISPASSTETTPKVSPAKTAPPSKPALKPKPQIKPKPLLTSPGSLTNQQDSSKSANPPIKSETKSESPPLPVEVKPPDRAESLSPVDNVNDVTGKVKPRAPARPAKSPQLHKAAAVDPSLDELIRSELNSAKAHSSPKNTRVPSDGSFEEEPKNAPKISLSRAKGPSLNELAASKNQVSFSTKQSQKAHAVGQSMFYGVSSPTTPSDDRPRSGSAPQFPVTFSDEENESLQRKPSGKRRPAPPRPSGPRPAPLSSKMPLVPSPSPSIDSLTPSRVPQRPAPPRPVSSTPAPIPPKRRKPRHSEEVDLLEFSPEKEAPPSEGRKRRGSNKHITTSQPSHDGADSSHAAEKSVRSTWYLHSVEETSSDASKDKNADKAITGLPDTAVSQADVTVSEENRQIIEDLDRRISEIDKDLSSYTATVGELEERIAQDESEEAKENLAFCKANIHGLTCEKQQLKENLHELDPHRALLDQERERRARRQHELAEQKRKLQEADERNRKEMVAKRQEKRMHVIAEVVQTEKDYLFSLSLCADTFLSPSAEKCSKVDLDFIFGNMDEVVELSQRLLTLLEAATSGMEFTQQLIGPCFVQLKEEMKRVYAPYCKNHDEVIALLEKLDGDEEVQRYFSKLLDIMREQCQVFDIGAILIKPVQRILKYPLLLNELIKCTEDEHEDKSHLVDAVNTMTDVASAINEFKRRKDLVTRYKKDKDTSIGDKFAKLNVHSTKKKLARLSQWVVGVQTIDQQYMVEERRFKALDISVRNIVRDLALYLDQLQDSVGCQESVAHDISDYYADQCQQQEVQQFCKVHNQVAAPLFLAFKADVEQKVIQPLNRLLFMFQGPTKVMKKRHDKLLDYDNLSAKDKSLKENVQNSESPDLQVVRQNYEALNAQLLDELPRLYELSMVVVNDCLRQLVASQRSFHQAALEQMYQLLSLQLVLGSEEAPIIEPFNIAHTALIEKISSISFVTKAFNPQVEERRKSRAGMRKSSEARTSTPPLMSQSASQQAYIRQMYPPEKLYTVSRESGSTQTMDLPVVVGNIVGVIKEGDPMGNKERWFIDNGVDRGFVMKSCLTPLKAVETSGSSGKSVPLDSSMTSSTCSDLMAFSPEKNLPPADLSWSSEDPPCVSDSPIPTSDLKGSQSDFSPPQVIDGGVSGVKGEGQMTRAESKDSLDDVPLPTSEEMGEFFQAVYAFQARNDLELTLAEGDVVKVVQKNDNEGNSEWWLVEAKGHRGYAPASYLYKIQ